MLVRQSTRSHERAQLSTSTTSTVSTQRFGQGWDAPSQSRRLPITIGEASSSSAALISRPQRSAETDERRCLVTSASIEASSLGTAVAFKPRCPRCRRARRPRSSPASPCRNRRVRQSRRQLPPCWPTPAAARNATPVCFRSWARNGRSRASTTVSRQIVVRHHEGRSGGPTLRVPVDTSWTRTVCDRVDGDAQDGQACG
jgi:hypothetical protein